MGDFSHLRGRGEAAMVDVSGKPDTARTAKVAGSVQISIACLEAMTVDAAREIARTARLAGIQGAKQTQMLVPLCHPLLLAGIDVSVTLDREGSAFTIEATTKTRGPTGVEMEALCAAAVAGLTVYDMVKAVDPAAIVGPFRLVQKSGGKSTIGSAPSTFDEPGAEI